ncbi:Phox-like protein [Rhizopogon salebrosus TDB-379]|nr:Phox-like protein [Rhizopogon salebrosus TDB-379]
MMQSPAPSPVHPFRNTQSLLVVIPDDGIDVEAEARLSPQGPPSVFSHDIWLDDHSGTSQAFAQNVHVAGWTSVGDKLGGAYVVYDCVIRTKEGTTIHAHKRYNDFVQLYDALRHSLPKHQHHFIPALPPKSPFSRYRAAFLDRRRRQLQYWLCTVFLHPEIGACQAVRWWVMN